MQHTHDTVFNHQTRRHIRYNILYTYNIDILIIGDRGNVPLWGSSKGKKIMLRKSKMSLEQTACEG